MGISLGDIGAFATGVVKADEAATAEKLKDRRAELQADRQLYIDMKTKKYESELKSFEDENSIAIPPPLGAELFTMTLLLKIGK